jgi:hypothetical protein
MTDVVAWVGVGISLLLSSGRIWLAVKLWGARESLPLELRRWGEAILLAIFIVGLFGLITASVLIVAVIAPESLRGLRWVSIVVLVVGVIMASPGVVSRIRLRRDRELIHWLSLKPRPSDLTGDTGH